MASSIRSAAMALPRVSMSRIPLVAFANSHITPASHANSSHPSAYSSMPARNGRKDPSSSSSWAESAKESAGKLERSAEKMAKTIDTNTKDYLREADKKGSTLSQHASDAIRMVESHSILKQDQAPIHAVSDEDPSEKPQRKHK